MKKIILSLTLASLVTGVFGQSEEEKKKQDWFHSDYATTGIYGVGSDAAINYLKAENIKPQQIVVAVIDSGVEVDHEDLKNNIWVNPGEIAGNGIDDDKNGYVDDINGWDFIGGKDGKDIDKDHYEYVRVYRMYNDKFNSSDVAKNRANALKYPREYDNYLNARSSYFESYNEAKNAANSSEVSEVTELLTDLKRVYGNGPLTVEGAKALTPSEADKEKAARILRIVENNEDLVGKTFDQIIKEFKEEAIGQSNDQLAYYFNVDFFPRKVIGDDYTNVTDTNYGNNEVEGPDALHGTHVSGIIAAERNNGKGMNGIAGDVAKIMVLRAVPDGDERDKDIANAIRYAVDNGAKIINMSFGKSYSPFKEAVWEAMKYADKKGVLMFHAAGNSNKDLDFESNYPTNFKQYDYSSFIKNWITVGASTRHNDKLKASFSNFGMMRVDLFAPGAEIYAPVTDGKYRYLQGTSMASPAAAGCAALLWAHFPKLKSTQVKDILMKTLNESKTEMIVGASDIPVDFNQLSVGGGVVDIKKAVVYANDKYGK